MLIEEVYTEAAGDALPKEVFLKTRVVDNGLRTEGYIPRGFLIDKAAETVAWALEFTNISKV